MNTLRLYISTLCHLKSAQFFYLVRHRLLSGGAVRINAPANFQLRSGITLDETLIPLLSEGSDYEFSFLNTSRSFHVGDIDWASADMPKLWRYNLHYFDYLHDKGRSGESLGNILSDWIARNPVGAVDAWEPYTASLRIVNWIKWFINGYKDKKPPRQWLESLYVQAMWLENNIERHLLANHYLKNAKALFFAGAYFSGKDADRWYQKGLEILREEAGEQILPDGGHYERSPMYHCIVIEDYLDVLNLCLNNRGLVGQDAVGALVEHTQRALVFLNDILLPDGQIPLFNDSALGIAPAPELLFDYAARVIQYRRPERGKGLCVAAKPESGYFMIRDGSNMLVVDCGQIGPDYQPGHAHCDTLGYELVLDGRRVIVDSGVYDYENSDERKYARSTRAHNTIVVDNQEQSEIWGVFRVASRARPINANLEQVDETRATFEGAHDGYRRLSGKVIHKRLIEYDKNKGCRITDSLQGKGVHFIESFIHFAPDLRIKKRHEHQSVGIEDASGVNIAELELPDNLEVEVVKGKYFPEFGISIENTVIRLYGKVALPFQTGYAILGL